VADGAVSARCGTCAPLAPRLKEELAALVVQTEIL
jgi:hypothetical protein